MYAERIREWVRGLRHRLCFRALANLREARTICSVWKRPRDRCVPNRECPRARAPFLESCYRQLIDITRGLQRGTEDIAFQFYAPDGGHEGKYGDKPSVDVLSIVDGINPEYGNVTPSPTCSAC